jgi:hypothetical protein
MLARNASFACSEAYIIVLFIKVVRLLPACPPQIRPFELPGQIETSIVLTKKLRKLVQHLCYTLLQP